jgi:hypothetical protein
MDLDTLHCYQVEFLRAETDSLAFMAFSDRAKLQAKLADALWVDTSIPKQRANDRKELRLFVMTMEMEHGTDKTSSHDDLTSHRLDTDSDKLGLRKGPTKIRMIKDRAKYVGLFGKTAIEAE